MIQYYFHVNPFKVHSLPNIFVSRDALHIYTCVNQEIEKVFIVNIPFDSESSVVFFGKTWYD